MTDTHPQRRLLSRIPFDADFRIHIDGDQTVYSGHVIDLSLKGALIERPPSLSVQLDDIFILDMDLGDGEVHIQMQVRVAHLHPQTLGVVREHLDLTSMSHLCRFLELNLGSHASLERELYEMLQFSTR
jgi:hypothetical protein